MSEDHQTVPASIWVRFAGDHIRMWKSAPFDEGEEYVHAAAKDAENAQLRDALKSLLPILEAFRGTVVWNESRWELIDGARALVDAETPVAAPETAQAAEIERLREALRPFAQFAVAFDASVSTLFADDDPIWYCPQVAPLTIGDMRRARAVRQTPQRADLDTQEPRSGVPGSDIPGKPSGAPE